MKKHILNILIFVSLFSFPARAVDFVHISEIFYNTPLNEVITAPPYSNGEYLELFNAGYTPADLTGWVVRGDGVTKVYTFGEVILPPQTSLILAYRHSRSPDFELSEVFYQMDKNAGQIIYQNRITLRNTSEFVRLYDATGLLRDSIFYGNTTAVQPISARLRAENANGAHWSECLSVQRKTVEFDDRGVAVANHLHWHVDFARPFSLSIAYIPPSIPIRNTPLELNLSSGHNYILSITPTTPISEIKKVGSNLMLPDKSCALVTVQYFDGLGRPVQTVQKGFTPKGNDLVSMIEYDAMGREYRQWLPVPKAGNNGAFVSPADVISAASNFPTYTEGNPFSEILYEASPLSRVLGTKNPGTAWHNRPTGVEYAANAAGEVKHFFINSAGQLQNDGTYDANTLYKTTTRDEDNKRTTEFTDKLGRVVMTRQSTNHDTYYVYDDFGNLRYILPPLAADALGRGIYPDTHQTLEQFAFVYKYDSRKRQVQKRLPGCDWIYYVYDKADRLVLSQDGNQRLQVDDRGRRKWTVYKYDSHGRVLYTGELTISETFEQWTNYFNNYVAIERYDLSYQYIADGSGYTRIFYHTQPLAMLTVNYYDNYDFLNLPAHSDWNTRLNYQQKSGYDSKFDNAHGLLTGTRTYILDGSGDYILTAHYYDYRGRVVQTRSTNHMGGFDINYFAYNFTGNVTRSLSEHSTNSTHSQPLSELYTYTYDHAGRLLETKYTPDGYEEVVSSNSYDELGRLTGRTRHNGEDSEAFEYNIRNWTTRIRSGAEFEQILTYNRPQSQGLPSFFDAPSYFNGNISSARYISGDYDFTYYFTYDALNRLTTASETHSGMAVSVLHTPAYEERFTYDKHGNITKLVRYGKSQNVKFDDPPFKPVDPDLPILTPVDPPVKWPPLRELQSFPLTGSGDSRSRIDDLTMTYRGNQLINVYDAAGGLSAYDVKEYQDLNNNIRVEDFRYDKNGNMTADLDRDIVTIQYNLLNLPALIQFRDGHQIRNTYAADGRKLRTEYITAIVSTTVPIGNTITLPVWNSRLSGTVYAGNKEYYFDIYTAYQHRLRRIHNPEGYVNYGFDAVSYNYYRRDHLGNVREVWNAGRCEIVEVRPNVFDCAGWLPPSTIQRTMYYPSGLLKDIGFGREQNSRLYNGQEFIEMHGLDASDLGWRQLHHAKGRFDSFDPLAELRPWESPYAFLGNNFVNRIDPDGREWFANEEDQLQFFPGKTESFDNWNHVGKTAYGTVNGVFMYGAQDGRLYDSAPLHEVTVTAPALVDNGGSSVLDWVQTGLDVVGLVPVWGEFADGINALIYLGRGDYFNAGLSAGAMIPFAGWAATGTKLGVKGTKAVTKSFKAVDAKLLAKHGITDIHVFKADYLGTKANLKHFDVVRHTQTGELLIIRQSTQQVIEHTGKFIR